MATMFPGDRVRLRFVAVPETCGTLLEVHSNGRVLVDWDDGVLGNALASRVEPIEPWVEWPADDGVCHCCGAATDRLPPKAARTLVCARCAGEITEQTAED